jgi:S1-C subfamily serine protease
VLIDNENDLALIQIEDKEFINKNVLPYKFNYKANVGERAFTIGFPETQRMGESYKVTDGIISSNLGIKDDPKYYQISVPIQHGNSGGALFNKDGNVIGITSRKIIFKGIENAGYAVKIAYLDLLLKNLPDYSTLISDNSLVSKSLDEQVKILKNWVCLIKVN